MNHRSPGLSISKAIDGFIQFKSAEGLSHWTVSNYERTLHHWLERQEDVDISAVSSNDIREYLNYMRNDYVPRRITGGNENKLSSKSIRNIYVAFLSFFHWASDEFNIPNPMSRVPAPKYTVPVVEPFTQEDVEALLKVCDFSEEAKTVNRRKFRMRRPTARRDRAIILALLDTGLRASELCSLRVGAVDLRTGKVTVKHGALGGAKGGKSRTVYLGKTARKAVWRYLADREDGDDPDAPLFLGKLNRLMNKDSLRLLLNSLGAKAGLQKCYPHRFRHTFAITYLRSGGDVFTLQMLLGHSTLDMVRRYALIAEIDMERVHRKASPVDNWRL